MVSSILLGLIGSFVAMIGMKCMKCLEDDEVKKSRMAILGGVIFLISGFAALVATSWYGNLVAQDFFNPYTPVNTSILGGAFLCCWCPRRETSYPPTRPYPKCVPSTGKDYV
ncbi:Claudin-1, partial [Ophiophagus hannah]